ncbi:MAG TPA: alpha-2-macroglobulin family protein, partial [Vicinamibacteria bacterium]|nr:alpha-2-macroglobulin family protein [Vicinamibacteria bacterium]
MPGRQEYRPGETAEVLVVAPFAPAEGLLTLRRSGIVRSERFRMESATHPLRVPIEDAFVPNVHVQVDLVGAAPREEGQPGTRPAFASGTVDLRVPPLSRTLAVEVAAREKALEPGGKTVIDVSLKDAAGRPVPQGEVALVVVDEAVLALTAYRLPDPLATFYAPREPGAADHHLRSSVVLAGKEVAAEQVEVTAQAADSLAAGMPAPPPPAAAMESRAKVGRAAGGAEPQPIRLRSDFNPLALFAASVITGGDGRAQVALSVPDSLTRYRVMAVAATRGREFGSRESTLTVRLPLMVRPSPPRFLNFGDRFELPVVVQNQTAQPMTVDVAVRAQGLSATAGAGRRVTVPASDRVEVRFP